MHALGLAILGAQYSYSPLFREAAAHISLCIDRDDDGSR